MDLSNNSYTASEVVTGSYDPNDKIARTSTGWSDSQYFLDQDSWIDYTIRFQNTGTDTAFTVVITDTLEADLDMSIFEMGASSHPVEVTFRAGRLVKWTFNNILLPDSNVNEAASHGLVSFRIKPVLPLLPGTLISNTANIYFDFNEPVITEPSVLVAEFSTGVQRLEKGQFRLQPNPTNDQLFISSDGGIDAVTVLAADGREMMRRSLRSSNTSIDVSALRSGAYVLLATLYNGSTLRERFINRSCAAPPSCSP
ncbi:MAG: T9SS type A sorting domain-containing protein [Flavobacteriales bacterium]|nr:T9SS type A sorting domain-containing protein [Flavobacteriales bacterium]